MPDLDTLERELGPQLRALAPPPPPGLATRVARPARRRGRPSLLVPALGLAAAALIALVVAAGALRPAGGGLEAGSAGEAVTGEPAPGGASAPQDASGGTVAPSPTEPAGRAGPPLSGGPDALGAPDRVVERSAELVLGTDDVDRAAGEVARATRAAGGYVADAQVAADPEGGSAAFTLRVPAGRLDVLLGRLGELGEVRSLRRAEQDVTGRLSDARRLLSDARDERRALLRALGRTTDPARVAALRGRLADVRASIDRRERAVRRVQRRAQVATVAVSLTGEEDGAGAATPLGVLRDVSGAMLLAGAAVTPPLLVLALVAGAWRLVRRRRRDAALA